MIALGIACGGAVHAQTVHAQTVGVQTVDAQTVDVQIVNVCDDAGDNCALSSPGRPYSYSPLAIQNILNQAGVAVRLLDPVQFNNSAYLNPAVIDDPANGYQTGNPVDPAHLLLNLPGHSQNTDPNVLNVFLVNSLPHTTALNGQRLPAGSLYGLGLQNANGAIAATGIFPTSTPGLYSVAGIDNIAHELGHNLGLLHVDGTPDSSPYNLLQGQNRFVPNSVCGIAGTSCDANGRIVTTADPTAVTVGQKDALLPAQTMQLQTSAKHLFTVDLAKVTATSERATPDVSSTGDTATDCTSAGDKCRVRFAYSNLDIPPNPESLIGLKVRYRKADSNLNPKGLNFTFGANNDQRGCIPSGFQNILAGGDAEIGLTIAPGCLLPVSVQTAVIIASGGHSPAGVQLYDLTPFSVQFTFDSGTTSRALFDRSGLALSTNPVAIGNLNTPNQDGPGLPVPTLPELFNALVTVEDTGGIPVTADGLPIAVPEPGPVGVLAAALLALLRSRRRMV